MQHFTFTPALRRLPELRLDRLLAAARTWWCAYQQQRRRRATVRILQSLGDHTLKDIGLDRSEIESAVADRSGRWPCRRVDFELDHCHP